MFRTTVIYWAPFIVSWVALGFNLGKTLGQEDFDYDEATVLTFNFRRGILKPEYENGYTPYVEKRLGPKSLCFCRKSACGTETEKRRTLF